MRCPSSPMNTHARDVTFRYVVPTRAVSLKGTANIDHPQVVVATSDRDKKWKFCPSCYQARASGMPCFLCEQADCPLAAKAQDQAGQIGPCPKCQAGVLGLRTCAIDICLLTFAATVFSQHSVAERRQTSTLLDVRTTEPLDRAALIQFGCLSLSRMPV